MNSLTKVSHIFIHENMCTTTLHYSSQNELQNTKIETEHKNKTACR